MALCIPIQKYRQVKKLRDDAVQKVEEVTKACCVPVERYRYMKRVHDDAIKKFEEKEKEVEEYKGKVEDLEKQMDQLKQGVPTSPKKLSMGGDDEADGGKCELEEEPYKELALAKHEPWPEDLHVKDVAKMSMVYLHSGHISRDPKSRRGTLTVKPMEVTIVNLSKKTTLHLGASFFKSGRFSSQPTGAIGIGESHTYSISSKDGRAKTGVKGGLAFIVYDVEEEVEEEEEKKDEENGEKKKKKKKEKKEKKKKEKKEKKDKKRKGKEEGEQDNKEAEENKEEDEEEFEKPIAEDEADGEEQPAEEKEEGEGGEGGDEEKKDDASNVGEEQEHKDHEDEDLPDGNGDFFICGFENPLAGNTKAKCNKTDSKDIAPLLKQLKNDKPVSQELFGHYKDGKRHFVFIWKDDDLEW